MTRASVALLLLFAVCACESSAEEAAPSADAALESATQDAAVESGEAGSLSDASDASDAAPPSDAPGDTGDSDADGPTEASAAVIAATSASTAIDFGLAANGHGDKRLDALDIAGDTGTLQLVGAAHRGVAYQAHDWGSAGYVLYDVLSIAEDGSDLAVTYLYCQGTNLPYAYTESLVHPMDWEKTTGLCDGDDTPTQATVSLPALTVTPEPIDTGIAIQGADLQLGPSGGHVKLDGETWSLVPFNTVDCTADCPGGSWIELHSMLLRDQQGCFAILYLFPQSPDHVQLSYTLCLPALERPTATYDAAWSGTLPPKMTPMMWRPAPPLPSPDAEWHPAH